MRSTPPSILIGLVRDEPRIVPPRGRMPRTCGDVERHGEALERALPAVAEADELVAVLGHALADDRADDRVETGAVAATGEHSDAHGSPRAWETGGVMTTLSWHSAHPTALGPAQATRRLAVLRRDGRALTSRAIRRLIAQVLPDGAPWPGDTPPLPPTPRTHGTGPGDPPSCAATGPRASVPGHDLLDRGPLRGRRPSSASPSPRSSWPSAPPSRRPSVGAGAIATQAMANLAYSPAASRCSPPAATPATSSPRCCPRTTAHEHRQAGDRRRARRRGDATPARRASPGRAA